MSPSLGPIPSVSVLCGCVWYRQRQKIHREPPLLSTLTSLSLFDVIGLVALNARFHYFEELNLPTPDEDHSLDQLLFCPEHFFLPFMAT